MDKALPQPVNSQLTLDKKIIQRMSAAIAILSLVTLVISFYFLPNIHFTAQTFLFVLIFGLAFFVLYLFLPQIWFHETFLMLGDAVYVALVTYFAARAGQYGILILFLYFVIIVADALKYPLSEYVVVVILTLQAAFFYIILWAPFNPGIKIGILTLFAFSTISIAVFVWYFISQTVYERSMRFVLERKSDYLKNMNDHLKAVDQMRTNMLRVTSHEFQTPIAAIQNSLALLKDSNFGKLSPDQIKLIQMASQNNERLNKLIHNLLDTARIQRGDWKLKVADTNFNDLIEDIAKEYKGNADIKGVKLVTELPRKHYTIKADGNMLRIGCKNLVDNAIKYTAKDGTVTLKLEETHDGLDFSVSDTGIGIKPDMIKHLFSQFARSENAISASPDGYGIGLYYSKLIVERHKGTISVKSHEGKGSTFTVHLPKSVLVK